VVSKALGALDRFCLRAVTRMQRGVPMRLAFGDGPSAVASPVAPVATVRVCDRLTLARLVVSPDLAFGEGYMDGRIEVEGDLVGLIEAIARHLLDSSRRATPGARLRQWWSGNGLARARRNVRHHYDLGNDFYRRWLDEELVYTCAYYADPGMTLEQAQVAKHEHVARKLDLRPGEMVYEAGCGWGSLALHLARRHGVRVRAWNVSREQIAWARARAAREGLDGLVEFIEDDYRRIDGTCDAFVSVGMLEHVGRRHHASLAGVIDRCLHPARGRGLLHFIGRNTPAPTGSWISKYIFPGAYLPSLREALGVLEPGGFSILDVENLRLHYARTLAGWLARFESAASEVRALFGERFVRMWRLYLAEAQAGFLAGSLQLFQVTFARPSSNDVPLTRAGLYR
jgi:cyclopropane-fatty-acyl-phospholipid synthase